MALGMKKLRRQNFMRHLELELFGTSLSGRVLWLTVGIILAVELVVLTPSVGHERQHWLWDHVSLAHMTALSTAGAQQNQPLDAATAQALLRLADVRSIKLTEPDGTVLLVPPANALQPTQVVYLGDETVLYATWRAMVSVSGLREGDVEVVAPSPLQAKATVDIVLSGAELDMFLRSYALHLAAISVIVALVTGLLVFAALDRMLVRPMRVMTATITGFRDDPEHAGQSELTALAGRGSDEIAEAAQELKAMLETMRAALWRNARLAALGTSVAKISHDLRNILSSALLVADQLQNSADPAAKRAARTLVPAVERAAQLVSRTVDFAREGPPAITRTPVCLREVVDEATQAVQPDGTGITIENHVPAELVLPLDRMQIYRVLLNLLRNATEAGAKAVVLTAETETGVPKIIVTDYGPGLPPRVLENLFKPFMGSGRQGGSGLGLAIARDLMRAHGGALILGQTSPQGTVFIMELLPAEMPVAPAPLAQNGYKSTIPVDFL